MNSVKSAGSLSKWKLDLGARGPRDSSTSGSRTHDLPSPPGYTQGIIGSHHVAEDSGRGSEDNQRLLTKRAWDLALGPLKQLPMNFFIMYMAGNSISIFPIMMVGMFFLRSAKALVGIGATFKALEDEMATTLIFQRFIAMVGNFCGICLALYKCSSMGLLPTHSSDWLDFLQPPERMEYSTGSIIWA